MYTWNKHNIVNQLYLKKENGDESSFTLWVGDGKFKAAFWSLS